MIDIADVPFSKVPEEEQKQFTSKIKEVGSYKGYKHRQFWVTSPSHTAPKALMLIRSSVQTVDNGVRDQIEHYNSTFSPSLYIIDSSRYCLIPRCPSAPHNVPATAP